MLEGLFDEEVTYDISPISSTNKKGSNCADNLAEPELPRGSSNFVGLYNQGATCYMNSALQILYMTPKFRNLINSLILCSKILGNPTEFIPQGQKYNIILSLQKLFSELNILNIKATKTKELTETFGWDSNDGRDQHDSQEFIRILLFDILEKILYDTPFNNIINNIYKVNFISYMECDHCRNLKKKIESEYVLNLTIMNINNLKESLYSSFGLEEIIDDYKCEKCEQKVKLKKWSKIISLPNYINFGLNRFTFDLNTLERVKLNNKFEFPLEINMKEFCDINEKNINEEEYLYELYGVIMHSGTPFSGHYYAYIRDMTGQGKWEIIKENKENKNINNSQNKEQEFMQNEEKNQNEININEEKKDKYKENNNNFINEKNEKINEINDGENNNENNKNKKGKRKNKKKKNNLNSKIDRMKNNSNNKNKDKNKTTIELDFEEAQKDFPLPYENKSLKDNWFEFNDTSVTSMPVSRLEKSFKGKASAYMLFYSKKENSKEKITLLPSPDYLKDFMNELNKQLEKERFHYEEEKNSFMVNIYEEKMFKLNKEVPILSLINNNEKENNKFLIEKKYKFSDKVSVLFEGNLLKNKNCLLFFFINKSNENLVIIEKIINEEMGEMTLKDIGFYHYCNIVFSEKESELFDLNIIKIGKEYEPVYLKFFYNGNIFELKTFGCYTISELKKILEQNLKIKDNTFEISFMSGNKQIILINDVIKNKLNNKEKSIKELNLEKKNLLTITPKNKCQQEIENRNENMSINTINQNNMISCIVKFEEDESTVEIIKISIDKTFYVLYETIYDKFQIIKEKIEIKEEKEKSKENKDFPFRLFNELENKIISKESFSKKILSSPTFVEGDVRLRIEIGEIYSENEISLTIIMKSPYEENKQIEREFICNPQKYTLYQVKTFLLDNFILENNCKSNDEKEKIYQNYLLYRVNIYNLPTKPYKNEKDTLTKVGIKERDFLFLQNMLEIPNEIAFINIIYSDKKANYYDLLEKFEPISFETKKKLELRLPKKTTVLQLKSKINDKISPNLLLVRVIGKYNHLERILKNDNFDLKKYNLESPINLFVEELNEPIFNNYSIINNEENENNDKKYKKNQKMNNKDIETMIILMQRNKKENKYENKKVYYIQNDPNIFGTKQLYDLCRYHSKWMNISIAKYNRGTYDYEEIQEFDENNNSFSLKKGNYFIRDSDWIAIKNLDEDDDFKT